MWAVVVQPEELIAELFAIIKPYVEQSFGTKVWDPIVSKCHAQSLIKNQLWTRKTQNDAKSIPDYGCYCVPHLCLKVSSHQLLMTKSCWSMIFFHEVATGVPVQYFIECCT